MSDNLTRAIECMKQVDGEKEFDRKTELLRAAKNYIIFEIDRLAVKNKEMLLRVATDRKGGRHGQD